VKAGWSVLAGAFALAGLSAATVAATGPYTCASHASSCRAPALLSRHAPGPVSRNVMVISIDGLRPDAIAKYNATVLSRLVKEGATSLEAETVTPSTTLPSHTSMLTGVPPEMHGIYWNEDETTTRGTVRVPTVFELAKLAGLSTAAFFSKPKLNHLVKPATLDHVGRPMGSSNRLATETTEDATRYIKRRRPNLVFVHIAEPDYAGHSAGWMTGTYGFAVRRADGAVGQLLKAADEAYGAGSYSVIISSDHGGHAKTHGTTQQVDMQIPWIAWGEGVQPGAITVPVKTTDTAATVLWLLGIAAPEAWTGKPVLSAYTAAARLAASSTH
jgi:predicted AlkP superfamily pyrophosphatase or phosphodiesterase